MTDRKAGNKNPTSDVDPEVPTSDGDPDVHLTEFDLARRLRCSVKTIRNQRVLGTGIPFMKLGRLVRYRLSDVIESEQKSVRTSTSELPRGND